MFRRIGYFIKEGLGSIFNHGLMSFITCFTIICCLIIMGSSSLLAVNIQSMIVELEKENEMVAYVDEDMSDEEARGLESVLLATANVARVEFVTREEAMVSFLSRYEDNQLFKDVDSSVFRNRYIVYLDDLELMEQTQNALANIPGIVWINAHLGVARGFVTLRNIVGIVSIALIVILFLVSIILMSNTMKIATFNRRTEIGIMKMVGATNSFIRMPFVLEGMLIGFFSSLIAFLIQYGLYRLLEQRVSGVLSFIRIIPSDLLLFPLAVVFVAIGLLEGILGSLNAIKSYLKV